MHRILVFILFFQGLIAYGQTCPILIEPKDGDVDVSVGTSVRWSEVSNAVGYIISLGTSPGGDDIISNRSSGLRNYYIPQTSLPADTQIYVTISYRGENQEFVTCEVKTFRTAEATTPPECTNLSSPLNGASNVDVETTLQWEYAERATGYLLSIGTTSGGTDIFDEQNVGDLLEFKPPDGLPPSTPLYITLIPYNEEGQAESCAEERFSTAAAEFDCGPYFDAQTGTEISFGPEIDFPEFIGLCQGETSTFAESTDVADGYRWFAIDADGSETLLSSTNTVELPNLGSYRYEAYDTITYWTSSVECVSSKRFEVVESERGMITSIADEITFQGRTLEVSVSGRGTYEYALDAIAGPYQDSPFFDRVSSNPHTVYVRDKLGCGIVESSVPSNRGTENFPRFFTPNGDDANDYWQFIAIESENELVLTQIEIFDRGGNLLTIINPESRGWDGTVRGQQMPSSDYWYRATVQDGRELTGHFTLKR